MDIRTEKLRLIQWITELTDEATLERIKWLMEHQTTDADWWDEISDAEKASIEKGLDDMKHGRVTPHDEIRKKYERWL